MNKIFKAVCFVLALLFTIAAVKGIMSKDFGLVLIIPAVAAILLIIAGLFEFKKEYK